MVALCVICLFCSMNSQKASFVQHFVLLNEKDQHGSSFTWQCSKKIDPGGPGGPAEMPLWLPSLLSVHTRRALT